MKLVIVRYPETNKIAGLPGDQQAPSPAGLQQIARLADVCKQQSVQAIVHSPSRRTVIASEVLAQSLDVPHVVEDGLRERNFGDWSKWVWPQIAMRLSSLTMEDRYTFHPPNGESWEEIDTRIEGALQDIVTLGHDSIAVMTHASCMRALMVLLQVKTKEQATKFIPPLGKTYVEDYNVPASS